MNKSKWFIHPIVVLICSVIAVFTSLVLYVYWYVEVSVLLERVVKDTGVNHSPVFTPQTWVVILVLSILVGLILLGISIIFTYNLKTLMQVRLQRNFINSFTHELRTPVASLKLYLETFYKYELPREDQLKYLSYMVEDADRLSNSINLILSLAKIENRTLKGDFIAKNLVEFVEEFTANNKHLFEGCDLNVYNYAGENVGYNIDVSLFEMMLINLLNNAIQYNKADRPRVDISFALKDSNLLIDFKDNGIGIPAKETRRIFRKFYQVSKAGDLTSKGTGLGLYLVESIVKLHKGRIAVASPGPDQGSVFTVTLPMKSAPLKA